MSDPASDLAVARRYLQAIERGVTGAELEGFFAPDVVFEVFRIGCNPKAIDRI
jgi:ketosteroid isomerase-like protein